MVQHQCGSDDSDDIQKRSKKRENVVLMPLLAVYYSSLGCSSAPPLSRRQLLVTATSRLSHAISMGEQSGCQECAGTQVV